MSYPTEANLTAFFGGLGISAPAGYSTAGALADAIGAWESSSGWSPFIKDASDRTTFVDPPIYTRDGMVLDLQFGIMSLTSLTINCEYDGTGGSALTLATDFILSPYDGGGDGKPYTSVRFVTYPWNTKARSIKIVGKLGYTTSCPADVSNAILSYAATDMISLYQQSTTGGQIKRVDQGDVKIEYSESESIMKTLRTNFKKAAARHGAPWL